MNDEYIIDPLGRGPKRQTPTQQSPAMRSPLNGDVAFQLAVGGMQPMFPDASYNKRSPPPPPPPPQSAHYRLPPQQQLSMSMQSGGYYQTTTRPCRGYDDDPIPPSPIQVYSMRQAATSSSQSGSQNSYGGSGSFSPHRNNDREERDPPPPSTYDHSSPYRQHHHAHHQHQDQYAHNNLRCSGEREQAPLHQQQRPEQWHYNDNNSRRNVEYDRIAIVNSNDPSPRHDHYHYDSRRDYHDRSNNSESNRQFTSRPQVPNMGNSHPNPQRDHQNYDSGALHHDHRFSRIEHEKHYSYLSPHRPQEHGSRYSAENGRGSYREASYEEDTSPLSIPSFVGGPPESNNDNIFIPKTPFTAQPDGYLRYSKETIEGNDGKSRRSNGSKYHHHDHYYSPPPESRDDFTGSSTIQSSSPPMSHYSPSYHRSHSYGGEYYCYPQDSMPRPQNMRGCFSVHSVDNYTLPNRTHPLPSTGPKYYNSPNKPSSTSSLPSNIARYHQAESSRRQSQARTQILKEIKQATNMKNSAVDENDRKFWERQISTLNESFRKL